MKVSYLVPMFCFVATVFGQSIGKNDFAFGGKLEITSAKSLIDFPLPEEVYQTTKSIALLDIGVFNAKDELVPHIILVPPPKVVERATAPVSVTYFPVYSASNDASNFSHLRITQDGTIVDIEDSKNSKGKKRLVGYIFKTASIEKEIETLQLGVSAGSDYFQKLDIEGSDDLKNWNSIERGAVLASFKLNKEVLIKNEISLQGSKYKYYRIVLNELVEKFEIVAATAHFALGNEKVEQPLQWKTVSGTKVEDKEKRIIYQYDMVGTYPVSAIKVKFADQNSVASFSVEATNDEKSGWDRIIPVTFFSVNRKETKLSNLEKQFPEMRYRFWKFTLTSSEGGIGSKFPEISFGWRPHLIRFLARGEGPFLLAFGSSKINNPPQPDLVRSDWSDDVGSASHGGRISLGGADKLVVEIVQPKNESPWRKFILAGVLLLGVLVLGSMALQLRKQV